MPIKSEQQRRFMAMCLHSPEKAKDKCPPKSVAKKFIHGHKKQEESSMNYIKKYFLNELNAVEKKVLFKGKKPTPQEVAHSRNERLAQATNQSVKDAAWSRGAYHQLNKQFPNQPHTSPHDPMQDNSPAVARYTTGELPVFLNNKGKLNKEGGKVVKFKVDQSRKARAASNYREDASTELNYRQGVRALFEAVVESKKGTVRFAGAGASTDTGGADLHPVTKGAADRVMPKGNIVRATGDGTSEADAALQRKTNAAQDAMNAALNPSEDEGAPPKNLPAPTNRRGNMKPETPGGKATNPYDRPIAGKLTVNKVAKAIAQMRGKK